MNFLKAIIAIVAIGAAGYFVYHVYQVRQTADLNNRASSLLEQGKFAQARDLLERASKKDPGNPVLWKNLGAAYEGLKDVVKAIEAYERSLALNPAQTDVSDNLAILKKAIEVNNQRITELQAKLKDKPEDAQLLARIGSAYENLGEFARAIEMYERSLKADPNQLEIRQRLDGLRKK